MQKFDKDNSIIFRLSEEVKCDEADWGKGDWIFHYHDHYEMELVTRGHGHQLFNGEYFETNEKDIYLLRPLDYHKHTTDAEVTTFFHILVREDSLPKWIVKKIHSFKNPMVFHLNDEDYFKFKYLFSEIKKELDSSKPRYLNPISQLVELAFIYFFALDQENLKDEDDVATKITYYLQSNYRFTQKVTLDEIAKYVGYSKFYTSSMFHKQYGMTIQEFIVTLRIEYAKKLIIETNYSMTEIIMECGFTSTSNFYSKFVKYVGCSPLQFRNKYSK